MKHHGNLKQYKKDLRDNLLRRLDTLFVLFPLNHPLHVKHTHTKFKMPERVKTKILQEVEGVILTAYTKGRKVGYEKGLVDGAAMLMSDEK